MSDTPKYSKYADSINVDAFEEEIGYDVVTQEGDEDKGFCLFPENHQHGDTTGKFSINREKMVYGCWVCGGGSLLSLAMEVLDLDEDEANDWLYQLADPDSVVEDVEDEVTAIFDEEPERPRPLPYFNRRVLDRYDEAPGSWLAHRGIEPWVATLFDLRFDAAARTYNKDSGESYEGPGIIIPHYHQGRLMGWQTRWVDDDLPAWVAKRKYLNTLDFPRERTLYGLDLAAVELSALGEPVFLVESTSTAHVLWSAGLAAVASFGAAVKDEQLRLLRRFQNGVVLAYDNDAAGRYWVEGRYDRQGRKLRAPLAEYLEDFIPVWVCDPPTHKEGADLGDLVGPDGYDGLYEHLAENQHDA